MIRGHIVENGEVVRFFFDVFDHIGGHLFCIDELGMELSLPGGYCAIEVHVVFGECSCFVEACEFDHSSCDDFILFDAKDGFFL